MSITGVGLERLVLSEHLGPTTYPIESFASLIILLIPMPPLPDAIIFTFYLAKRDHEDHILVSSLQHGRTPKPQKVILCHDFDALVISPSLQLYTRHPMSKGAPQPAPGVNPIYKISFSTGVKCLIIKKSLLDGLIDVSSDVIHFNTTYIYRPWSLVLLRKISFDIHAHCTAHWGSGLNCALLKITHKSLLPIKIQPTSNQEVFIQDNIPFTSFIILDLGFTILSHLIVALLSELTARAGHIWIERYRHLIKYLLLIAKVQLEIHETWFSLAKLWCYKPIYRGPDLKMFKPGIAALAGKRESGWRHQYARYGPGERPYTDVIKPVLGTLKHMPAMREEFCQFSSDSRLVMFPASSSADSLDSFPFDTTAQYLSGISGEITHEWSRDGAPGCTTTSTGPCLQSTVRSEPFLHRTEQASAHTRGGLVQKLIYKLLRQLQRLRYPHFWILVLFTLPVNAQNPVRGPLNVVQCMQHEWVLKCVALVPICLALAAGVGLGPLQRIEEAGHDDHPLEVPSTWKKGLWAIWSINLFIFMGLHMFWLETRLASSHYGMGMLSAASTYFLKTVLVTIGLLFTGVHFVSSLPLPVLCNYIPLAMAGAAAFFSVGKWSRDEGTLDSAGGHETHSPRRGRSDDVESGMQPFDHIADAASQSS
ncbi:hypothetical protein FH972_023812 [Carpinus fangiana]|uniref:Uncharacterized protein n=1 Tax=Carpinus fangiana TaxID=176857 RepID=A0A5N6KWX6_9ROSI|nr:hypothetical protein FH972_023812 [Carpinus fangiana]